MVSLFQHMYMTLLGFLSVTSHSGDFNGLVPWQLDHVVWFYNHNHLSLEHSGESIYSFLTRAVIVWPCASRWRKQKPYSTYLLQGELCIKSENYALSCYVGIAGRHHANSRFIKFEHEQNESCGDTKQLQGASVSWEFDVRRSPKKMTNNAVTSLSQLYLKTRTMST